MAKFRIDSLSDLARQLAFSPGEARLAQIAAAEELLHTLDPAKAYPIDFVIFRITGYRPKAADQVLLPGAALQHDLGQLIEAISESLDLRASELAEPVLSIEDACEKFNVTSKTIQRWRRKGLPARRLIFADGRRRVGFLLSSVERFIALHENQVATSANFSQVTPEELARIIRNARRLVAGAGCSEKELTRRIARRVRRSPLTVLHLLRKHDQDFPADPVLSRALPELCGAQLASIARLHDAGVSLREVAAQLHRPRCDIYRALIERRIERLKKRKMRFIDDPLYHQEGAARILEAMLAQEQLTSPRPGAEEVRVPRDLPACLAQLCRTPLLTPAQERALFLKFNFHKFQFASARRRLDPELARRRDLDRLDGLLHRATEVKNAIVVANLRLVVSVARKHLRAGLSLMELVSEGNVTLMRAVEGFDVHRGHRFSTYATLALMKGFARAVPQMVMLSRRSSAGVVTLSEVPDHRLAQAGEQLVRRDQVTSMMSGLSECERLVLSARFGLDEIQAQSDDDVGARLGMTGRRVRRIHQSALQKLREAARAHLS